jgi:hypothetical protein
MDQVSGLLPLIPLNRRFRLKVSQPAQTESGERPGEAEEDSLERVDNVAEM